MGIDIKTTTHIYNGETFISEHTNKPIDVDNTEEKKTPIFWCEVCQVRLRTAHTAIQHIGGRPHRGKMMAKGKPKETSSESVASSKRKLDDGNGSEPSSKHVKQDVTSPTKNVTKASDPNLACEDCNLKFDNAMMAIQHFKGKKHAAVISKKVEEKKVKISQFTSLRGGGRGGASGRGNDRGGRFNDRGGRGGMGNYHGKRVGDRGGRGGGRGSDRFGGYNSTSQYNDQYSGANAQGGVAAGQLVRALKNFYNQTSAALSYPSASSSWNGSSSSMYSRFNLNDRAQTNYLTKEYFSSTLLPSSTRDAYQDDRSGRLSFYDDIPLASNSSGYKFSDSNSYGSRDYKRR